MRLESVDFTLLNWKSVVNRTISDVHFLEIDRKIADSIAFLVTRSSFLGRSIFPCEVANFSRQTGDIENLNNKKIQKPAEFRKINSSRARFVKSLKCLYGL